MRVGRVRFGGAIVWCYLIVQQRCVTVSSHSRSKYSPVRLAVRPSQQVPGGNDGGVWERGTWLSTSFYFITQYTKKRPQGTVLVVRRLRCMWMCMSIHVFLWVYYTYMVLYIMNLRTLWSDLCWRRARIAHVVWMCLGILVLHWNEWWIVWNFRSGESWWVNITVVICTVHCVQLVGMCIGGLNLVRQSECERRLCNERGYV